MLIIIGCIFFGCMVVPSIGAIECYGCTNSSSLPACTTIIKCPTDSVCSSEYTTVQGTRFYTLGCRNILSCPISSTVSSGGTSSIIGRRAARINTSCSECCNSNYCNRQLCQDPDPFCADEKDYNCEHLGSVINICVDDSHVKPYCKRFCGFCNTDLELNFANCIQEENTELVYHTDCGVDGGWSSWSEWGNCDVTCGNGTRTKTRTCSDPPPANEGSDCVGGKEANEPCSKDLCPVHGGWSSWSEWGSCSVTCDVGLQRKDRTCSNPYPARYGDHCYGDSRADRLCFPGACVNGSWSSWSPWGHCDQSCDGGVKSRARDCDNPAPSLTGRYCSGDTTEAESCNVFPCQGPVLFFAKELPSTTLQSNATLRFVNVITNVGEGYNSSTGFFTAPVNGSYSFNVQFCAYYRHYANVGLVVNGVRVTNMVTYGEASDTSSCRTLSVPIILKQGDKVQAKTDTQSSQHIYQDASRINSFSGTLIQLLH